MERQQMTNARQLFTAAEKLGLKLPKPVLQAQARLEKIRTGADAIPAHALGGVAAAVADALGRDADPTTDPEVARAIAHSVITGPGVLVHVEEAAFTRLWDVIAEHQDEIVDQLRTPFDRAAATLVDAHSRIGDLDLTADSGAILKMGGNIATVWAEAVAADKLIDSVVLAWVGLGQLIHPEIVDRHWMNLRLVNTTAAEWDQADLSRKAITAWDAARLGIELSLPTRAEYNARREAITEQRADAHAIATATPKRPSYA